MTKLISIFVIAVAAVGFLFFYNKDNNNDQTASPTPTVSNETTQIKSWDFPPDMAIDQSKTYIATMKTNKGEVELELFANETPFTVNNFVFLANEGFYNGTKFHRIIQDFMIQGGDPTATGRGGPGYTFNDESITRDYTRGTIAMANAGPNTNGSQFFIMHKDEARLPKNYVIFGQVVKGIEVIDDIAATPVELNEVNELSKPTEDIIINEITIREK